MMSVRLLFSVIWIVILSVPLVHGESERMNLLLITADDLGVQLGCYGDDQARSPRLDAFAKDAVRFEVAHVAQASCSPSRSAMLTGLYPHSNGQYGLANTLRQLPMADRFGLHPVIQKRTLPNLLKKAGYRTGVIGKLHINPESSFQLDLHAREGFGSREIEKQSRLVANFISADKSKPWFLMANLFDPHVAKLQTGGTDFPDQVKQIPPSPRTADDVHAFPFQRISDKRMLSRIAGYYNCVERVDTGIGLFLDELEQSGQVGNTVVIILGDHGPPVGRGKTTCYEAGLRVPFLVRWPGVSTPHVSSKLVSAVDITPTFLDAAGVQSPDDLQGQSLRSVLSGQPDERWRTHLFAEFQFHGSSPYFPRRSVRNDRYKLIHNPLAGNAPPVGGVDSCPSLQIASEMDESSDVHEVFERLKSPPQWELYDLKSDPWEWKNLAKEPAMREIRDELADRLMRWRETTSDPFLDPEFVHTLPGQE